MRILVYGAGNIGCLYAALLAESGHQVAVLSRGRRLADLRTRGIRLVEWANDTEVAVRVPTVEHLDPEDAYDLVLVVLPRHRVAGALPVLAANGHTPGVLFFGNCAAGPGELIEALGAERVLLGFPGAAGHPEDGRIRYLICSPREQPTTLGELDGARSERIGAIAGALKGAGFPVTICPRMDAWLKTHAAKVAPTVMALFMCGGDRLRLARTRDALVLMVRGIREVYRVLKALGVPITPGNHRILEWLPEPMLVAMMRRMIASDAMAVKIGHAEAALDEWRAIADELEALTRQAGVSTPAMDKLRRHLETGTEPIADGSTEIPMRWRAAS